MEKREIQQQLLLLENTDVVREWFQIIHKRELKSKKNKEINSAAKQSSEFFRNAALANNSVRPLLTYYGINTLSKALILLLDPAIEESNLKSGHGLATKKWNNTLFKESIGSSLRDIGKLEVKTCTGLFSELVRATDNTTYIHAYSSNVDWRLPYDVPQIGFTFTLNELLSRIPDLDVDLKYLGLQGKYCSATGLSYSESTGFTCKVETEFDAIRNIFESSGYCIEACGKGYNLKCNPDIFEKKRPLFYHKYVNKVFSSIPEIFIVQPFDDAYCYSEMAILYLLSYYLGMLVRYYPTHWNALIQGEKGDIYWPILNRAQKYTEMVFPELVVECINDILKQ